MCCDFIVSLSNRNVPAIRNLFTMAVIVSMGVGRAKKSMGNVTYRTVRGRTIGSQKRVSGVTGAITRGQSGNIRKPLFAMINMYMAEHASDIQVSFNKSKYGSQRNYFFAKNYQALFQALNTLAVTAASAGVLPFLDEVEAAITAYAAENPTRIYRVKLDGFNDVFLSGAWSADDNPISGGATDGLGVGTSSTTVGSSAVSAPVAVSLNFHSGAKIVHNGAVVEIVAGGIPSGVIAADIQYLTAGNTPISGITPTNVASSAGSLRFTTPAITVSQNAIAVKVKSVYIRLTSAYATSGGGDEENPLG